MPISEKTHKAITRIELLGLIDACERCECSPDLNCYCASNLEWAQRKLKELDGDDQQQRKADEA